MSIAKVTEISASSTKSFEDAIRQGIERSAKTVRNMRKVWINEQNVIIRDDKVVEWHVNMRITFVLDD